MPKSLQHQAQRLPFKTKSAAERDDQPDVIKCLFLVTRLMTVTKTRATSVQQTDQVSFIFETQHYAWHLAIASPPVLRFVK